MGDQTLKKAVPTFAIISGCDGQCSDSLTILVWLLVPVSGVLPYFIDLIIICVNFY